MAKEKSDYSKKEKKELLKDLSGFEKKIIESGISASQGKTKDLHTSRKLRKEVAKIKSAFRMKELAQKKLG